MRFLLSFHNFLNEEVKSISGSSESASNSDSIISLDVSWSNISDLNGIQDFTSLVDLSCQHNELNSLKFAFNVCTSNPGILFGSVVTRQVCNKLITFSTAPAFNASCTPLP